MDAGTLYNAIAEVCPVASTSVGKPDDRTTWSFDPAEGATQPEIDAGNNVIATITTEVVPSIEPSEFVRRFTDPEYLALKQRYDADLTANDVTGIKAWDLVIASSALDLNGADAQALKSDLVADGILTQARADEIFGAGPTPVSRTRKKG